MNLIWFLTAATIFSITLGEYGQYPFGVTTLSISLTDFLLSLTLTFLSIWLTQVKVDLYLPKVFKVLMLFWLTGAVSLIFSGNLQGGLYLVRFVIYSLSFLLGYYLIKLKTVPPDRIPLIITQAALFFCLIGFGQLLLLPDLEQLSILGFDPHKSRLVSTFLDPNFAGVLINIGFILSIYLWNKNGEKLWLGMATIFLISLILTFSRSAYLMLLTALLMIGFLRIRKLIFLMLVVFLVIYLSLPRFSERIEGIWKLDSSASERIDSWNKGVTIFQNNPILGVGFNNLSSAFEKYQLIKVFSKDGGHSASGIDSSLLTVLATTGILGLVSFLGFWVLVSVHLIKADRINKKDDFPIFLLTIIVSLFINSQFINSLFYPPNMLITYLLVGSYYGSID